MGKSKRHFTNYHRLLNRGAWSCLAAGQVLLGLILAVLPKDAPLVLAADDTRRLTAPKGPGPRRRPCPR